MFISKISYLTTGRIRTKNILTSLLLFSQTNYWNKQFKCI